MSLSAEQAESSLDDKSKCWGHFFFLVFKLCQSVTQCAGAALSGNTPPQRQSLGRQLSAGHVHCKRRSLVAEKEDPWSHGVFAGELGGVERRELLLHRHCLCTHIKDWGAAKSNFRWRETQGARGIKRSSKRMRRISGQKQWWEGKYLKTSKEWSTSCFCNGEERKHENFERVKYELFLNLQWSCFIYRREFRMDYSWLRCCSWSQKKKKKYIHIACAWDLDFSDC